MHDLRCIGMTRNKNLPAVLLGVAIAIILWMTILSREKQIEVNTVYQPFHALVSFLKEIQRGRIGTNFLGNIILFIPFGFLLPCVTDWNRMWKTVVTGLGFSLVIEIIQLITSRGCFDFDDVILNGLGCVIGYGIHRAARKLFTKGSLNTSGI